MVWTAVRCLRPSDRLSRPLSVILKQLGGKCDIQYTSSYYSRKLRLTSCRAVRDLKISAILLSSASVIRKHLRKYNKYSISYSYEEKLRLIVRRVVTYLRPFISSLVMFEQLGRGRDKTCDSNYPVKLRLRVRRDVRCLKPLMRFPKPR